MRSFLRKKIGLFALVGSCALLPALGIAQSSGDVSTAVAATTFPSELTLQRLVSHLLAVNKNVLSKRFESGIVTTGIDRAEAAFQPQVTASVANGNSITKNNAEDKLIRSNLDV